MLKRGFFGVLFLLVLAISFVHAEFYRECQPTSNLAMGQNSCGAHLDCSIMVQKNPLNGADVSWLTPAPGYEGQSIVKRDFKVRDIVDGKGLHVRMGRNDSYGARVAKDVLIKNVDIYNVTRSAGGIHNDFIKIDNGGVAYKDVNVTLEDVSLHYSNDDIYSLISTMAIDTLILRRVYSPQRFQLGFSPGTGEHINTLIIEDSPYLRIQLTGVGGNEIKKVIIRKSPGVYQNIAGKITGTIDWDNDQFSSCTVDSVSYGDYVGRNVDGSTDSAIINCYNQNGGSQLGLPVSNLNGGIYVHAWGAGVVQDYGGDAMCMHKNGVNEAYVVKDQIRTQYISKYSGAIGSLGYPTSNQILIDDGAVQNFENGYLLFSSSTGNVTKFEGKFISEGLKGDNGLSAEYYSDMNLSAFAFGRIDPNIIFNWSYGSPDSSIGMDNFSVRWTGFIESKYSENYSFYTVSDDGARLWVDDKLIINDWSIHSYREKSGSIVLESGKKYPIKLEYFERSSSAAIKLMWSSESQSKDVVPSSQLVFKIQESSPVMSGGGGSGGGGSSGGGGGSSSVQIYSVSELQFDSGYNHSLKIGDKMKFKIGGDIYLVLEGISGSRAIISTGSEKFNLEEGGSKNLDLNHDGVDDFYIKIDNVKGSEANIFIKSIMSEEVTPVQSNQTTDESLEEGFDLMAIVFPCLLIISLIIILYFIYKFVRKGKPEKRNDEFRSVKGVLVKVK